MADSGLVRAAAEGAPGVARAGAAAPAAAEAYGKLASLARQQAAERERALARVAEEVARAGPVAELETVAAVGVASGAVDRVEVVEEASAPVDQAEAAGEASAAADQVEAAEVASAAEDQAAVAEEAELEAELAPGLVQPASRASG